MENKIGLSYFNALFDGVSVEAISQFLASFCLVEHKIEAMFPLSNNKIFICISTRCSEKEFETVKNGMRGRVIRVDGSVPSPFFTPKPPDEGI